MKKRITAFLLCTQMVLFTMFQVTSVVMAEEENTAIAEDVIIEQDIAVAAEEGEESETGNTLEWISYRDFIKAETTKAWNDPEIYVGQTAYFDVDTWQSFEVSSGFNNGVKSNSIFVSSAEFCDEDGNGLQVVITDYYLEENTDWLWYKVEAVEGDTLPEVLVNNPYVLHLDTVDANPSLIMLPKKGMFVGETVLIQSEMVATGDGVVVNVADVPAFFDVTYVGTDQFGTEWYDLGDVSTWTEGLSTEYHYVSATNVILIPAIVSRAYEDLTHAESTDDYNFLMSVIPEEVTSQFTDKHIADIEAHLEYLHVIENVEQTTTVNIGGKEIAVTVTGEIPQQDVATLTVEEVPSGDVLSGGFDIKDASEIVTALDIKIINKEDGTEWQPEEGCQITVSIDVSSLGYEDGQLFRLHHKHGNDITVFEIFVVMDGKVTIGTNGFSLYVISKIEDFNKDNLTASAQKAVLLDNASSGITLEVGKTAVYYFNPGTGEQGTANSRSTWWVTDPEGAIYYELYSSTTPGKNGVNAKWIKVTALKSTIDEAGKDNPVKLKHLYVTNSTTIEEPEFSLSIVVPKPVANEDTDGYKLYIKDTVNTTGLITATLVDENGKEVTEEKLEGKLSCSWTRDDGAYIHPNAYQEDGKSIDICVDHGGLLQTRLTNVTYTVTATLPDGRKKTASYTVYYQSEILNSSFESPEVVNNTYTFLANGWPGLYWKTTNPGNTTNHLSKDVEFARYDKNGTGQLDTTNFYPSRPGDGDQIAELNAENFGALYQDIITAPLEIVSWEFLHAKRNTDTRYNNKQDEEAMFLIIGPTEYAQEITSQKQLTDLVTNILEQNNGREAAIEAMAGNKSIQYVEKIKDSNGNIIVDSKGDPITAVYQVWYHNADTQTGVTAASAWTKIEGEYEVPEGQYRTRLFFVTDPGIAQQLNYGNLIDSAYGGQYKEFLIEYYEEYFTEENGTTVLKRRLIETKENTDNSKMDETGRAIMYSSVKLNNYSYFENENDLLSTVLINGQNSPYNIKYNADPCLFIENYPKVNIHCLDEDKKKLDAYSYANRYAEYDIVMQVCFRDTMVAVQKWVQFPTIVEGDDAVEALTAMQKQELIQELIAENGNGYESSVELLCVTENHKHFANKTITIAKNDPAGWYTGYIPIGDNPDGQHEFALTETYASSLTGLELDQVVFNFYRYDKGEQKEVAVATIYENLSYVEEIDENGVATTQLMGILKGDSSKKLRPVRQENITLDSKDSLSKIAEIKVTNIYKEKNATITYKAVGNGHVEIQDNTKKLETEDSETFAFYSGEPDGVIAKPEQGYTFAGWYLDEACTKPVDKNHGYVDESGGGGFIPNKGRTISDENLNVTYYAKFSIGSIQIIREDAEPGQVFVYKIEEASNPDNFMYATVVIGADRRGSTEIVNVPFGANNEGSEYTVTQLNSWSWRYGDTPVSISKVHKEEEGLHGSKVMTTVFTFPDDLENPNEEVEEHWLNGNSDVKLNKYGGAD